ncbi:MAG: sigma-70 family RNA polymerase sigma factor [Chloroflexi bacterium]|nr:sigma-70 family RNA polymerase sigma factor [Chloroflexota bacterium]
MLERFCRRLVGDEAAAQDLAQEALLRVHRSLGRLEDPARFGAWLCGIAANLARTWWRRQVRSPVSLEGLATSRPDGTWEPVLLVPLSPEQVVEEAEQTRRVLDAVESLPAPLGRAVALYYLEGLSYAEVAATLDVPVSTVKSRLFKSRSKLRLALEGAAETAEMAEAIGAGSEATDSRRRRETMSKKEKAKMTSTQAPTAPQPKATIHCSFCARPAAEVPRLIAGPGSVYICSDCVAKCNEIIAAAVAQEVKGKGQAVSAADLSRYTGRYATPEIGEVEIGLIGGQLIGTSPQLPAGITMGFTPEGEHAFRVAGGPENGQLAVFEMDEAGKPTAVRIDRYRLTRQHGE